MRPLRPCRQAGCSNLVQPPEKYCSKHKWTDEQREQYRREQRRDSDKEYNKNKRDKKAQEFYNSFEWQQLRVFVLNRDNYLCRECFKQKRIARATHVDHIIPIAERWDLRLDPDNCQSLCVSCHTRKTNAEQRQKRATHPQGGLENFLGFTSERRRAPSRGQNSFFEP